MSWGGRRPPRIAYGVGVPVQEAGPSGHGVGMLASLLPATALRSDVISAFIGCVGFHVGSFGLGKSECAANDSAAMSLSSVVSAKLRGPDFICVTHACTALKFQSSKAVSQLWTMHCDDFL